MRTVVRILLYGLLVAAVIVAIVSFRWYRWQGYTCRLEGDGITVFSDYDSTTASRFHRLCRAFRQHFDRQIWPVPMEEMDLKIYLFKDPTAYDDYCRRVRSAISPFGFYSRRHRLIVVNGRMGWLTVFHEMVHYFAHSRGYRLSEYLEEGLATYFERCLGYVESENDFQLFFGYLNPIRFQEVRDWAYRSCLTFADMRTNQYLAGTFFVFADRRRALDRFLKSYIQTQDLDSACHQAFDAERTEVERQWNDFIKETVLGLDYGFWQDIGIFLSRQGFEEFLEDRGARWDQESEIFTVNRQ